MSEPEPPITPGLSAAQPTQSHSVDADDLQFQRAEPVGAAAGVRCVACRQPIAGSYFHAAGHTVCPVCAENIQKGQQAPPVASLAKAAIYGGGAALAGCAIYAALAIVLNLEIALIAILVGFMVGKAIRHASRGLGGRSQQILAVALTYFAITTSYFVVAVYNYVQHPKAQQEQTQQQQGSAETQAAQPSAPALIGSLLLLIAAAPFYSLGNVSGWISLVIIFFGLQRAWRLTGRTDILITGPYEAAAR